MNEDRNQRLRLVICVGALLAPFLFLYFGFLTSNFKILSWILATLGFVSPLLFSVLIFCLEIQQLYCGKITRMPAFRILAWLFSIISGLGLVFGILTLELAVKKMIVLISIFNCVLVAYFCLKSKVLWRDGLAYPFVCTTFVALIEIMATLGA